MSLCSHIQLFHYFLRSLNTLKLVFSHFLIEVIRLGQGLSMGVITPPWVLGGRSPDFEHLGGVEVL